MGQADAWWDAMVSVCGGAMVSVCVGAMVSAGRTDVVKTEVRVPALGYDQRLSLWPAQDALSGMWEW